MLASCGGDDLDCLDQGVVVVRRGSGEALPLPAGVEDRVRETGPCSRLQGWGRIGRRRRRWRRRQAKVVPQPCISPRLFEQLLRERRHCPPGRVHYPPRPAASATRPRPHLPRPKIRRRAVARRQTCRGVLHALQLHHRRRSAPTPACACGWGGFPTGGVATGLTHRRIGLVHNVAGGGLVEDETPDGGAVEHLQRKVWADRHGADRAAGQDEDEDEDEELRQQGLQQDGAARTGRLYPRPSTALHSRSCGREMPSRRPHTACHLTHGRTIIRSHPKPPGAGCDSNPLPP